MNHYLTEIIYEPLTPGKERQFIPAIIGIISYYAVRFFVQPEFS